jgi:hypothetical protein
MKFEELYEITQGLVVPDDAEERRVAWCDASQLLGLARQPSGAFELFLRGDPLAVRSPLVRRHLRHDTWRDAKEADFPASRIAFPAEAHYQAVAAFIAEELFRNGLLDSVARSFGASEPIIEMSLRRAALSDEAIIGLIGELRLLAILISVADTPADRAVAIEAWRGYQRDVRDFVFAAASVEVKTTRGGNSVHDISSLGQVDPARSPGGTPIEQLYLVSFGLAPVEPGEDAAGSLTLPSIIDALLLKLGDSTTPGLRNEIQEILIERIRQYGGGSLGYDHDSMSNWPAYSVPFRQRFGRAYDMNDDAVLVLRRAQIAPCSAVREESVRFEVALPDQITGDINPETDLFTFVRRVTG